MENFIVSSPSEQGPISTIRSSLRAPSTRDILHNGKPKENPRNLVVCIDGTSNRFGHNNTNVVKLFADINLESVHPEQHAYYSSGIGTRPKSLHILSRLERLVTDKFDMAVAWNMEEIVKDAYGWLARTYREGDRIYLFGFSRGAYQVRVLAGMIHEVGLIRTQTEKQIGTAYDHYEAIRSGKPKTRQIAREFKNTFSWKDLRVHFVGVWDTVSSVGLIRGDVFLSTSSSAAHACHFRHALALDERRVKFMPEYFHEMNAQTDGGKSKYIVTSDVGHASSPASEWRKSNVSDSRTYVSGEKKDKTTEIKEVWFAGTHSDVGGTNRPGKSYQAGNASLLWMRREAAESGLVLHPTDIVWVPDDLDFGTIDSMTRVWRAIEYMPIKHQVSFSGSNDDVRRWHRMQPRRIIPGQKVHASVLYANAYKPQASMGEGFDIPIVHTELDTELDSQFWETGLFDKTAAQELVAYLGGKQGVAPIYLDRLLFMLRFKEGKEWVRNVPNWHDQFTALIYSRDCAPLVRLVTIVAYYEASHDSDTHQTSSAVTHGHLSDDVLDNARKSLTDILAVHRHRDGPRVIALLRPLARHQKLRERILTQDVLDTLVKLLDAIVVRKKGNFGQAMDGINSLLQCGDTREIIIGKLGEDYPNSKVSRLSQILAVKDSHLLTAALRMVVTLVRIPEGKDVCSKVKPRIRQLAKKNDGLVGLLCVEILLVLYEENDPANRSNILNTRFRANLACALSRLNTDSHDSADGEGRVTDPVQQVLRRIFGLDALELNKVQKRLIGELKRAVQKSDPRERTAATLTLLKLCETDMIRTYLLQVNMLDIFVKQLRRKDSALLAAYALATCLKYNDMKESLKKDDLLPKHIVGMLRLDFFDDAVGRIEGFQIFGDFMQHDFLREKIKGYKIAEVLDMKLGKAEPKEVRTSLICLDIFRSFGLDGPLTNELVDKSLKYLRNPFWSTQKAGVTILSALARTEHGVAAINPKIPEIIEMLLPEGYSPIQPTAPGASTSPNSGRNQAPPDSTPSEPTDSGGGSHASADGPSRPSSWMMGPACALLILAQNKVLRDCARETLQYGSLKHLYLSGTLVDDADTSALRVWTPNRSDVVDVLEKVIRAVDEELSEGLTSVGATVLPHIRHWDRLAGLLRGGAVVAVAALPAALGVSALAVLTVIFGAPVYLSVHAYEFLERVVERYQDTQILDSLRGAHAIVTAVLREGESATGPSARDHEGEGVPSGHDGGSEGPSGGHDSEGSCGVGAVGARSSGDTERTSDRTSP